MKNDRNCWKLLKPMPPKRDSAEDTMDNQQGNLMHIMDKYVNSIAYSIGALTGDGTVKKHVVKRNNSFAVISMVNISAMDIDCVERVCYEINEFFGKSYQIVEYKNPNDTTMFRLAINKKVIFEFFNYFIREKLNISDEIFRANKKARLDYLAGLFDTDGYVSESKNPNSKYGVSWRVGFASRHRTFVEDTNRLLSKIGVKVGKIYEQTSQYDTRMYVIKPNIRSFIDAGCYFQIPRKAKRLANYESAVKPSETIMSGPRRLGQDIVRSKVKAL